MLVKIYSILLVYFLIGAVGIFFINSKEKEKALKRERWLKYFVYLILVNIVIATIYYGYFLYLAIIIVLLGLYEIINSGYHNIKSLIIALPIYLFLCLFFILSHKSENWFLLSIYFLILTFDGFSQITGQLFGKNKLASKISPGKTFEGFLGGIISVTITLCLLTFPELWPGILFITLCGIILSLLAVNGDLLASYYKRINNLKDYSNIIPGHGGILDRFDSFIFTIACIEIYYYLTSLIL